MKWTIEEYDPEIPMDRRDHGTCTICGEADCDLLIVDDVDRVCMGCLDRDYQLCDGCGEYYSTLSVEFTLTEDDKFLCQNCLEGEEDE